MATKFLNLDDFAPAQRTVTVFGVEYKVADMTVERFIDSMKRAQKFSEKQEKMSTSESFEEAIEQLKLAIPDMPVDVMRRLTVDQLGVLIEFVRGELLDRATKEAVTQEAEAKGEAEGNVTKE